MFNEEFGQSRSMAFWRWKFLDNPWGGPDISLARRRDDDAIVGNHVLMPFPLNVAGTRVLAGHSLDLVVRRAYRGQGIFETAGNHCIDAFRARGGRAVVAFPNAASYPGFVRSLGWNRILFPTRWSLRLDVGAALRRSGSLAPLAGLVGAPARVVTSARLRLSRMLGRRSVGAVTYESGEGVPGGYDALWNEWRSQEVVSVWKDADYLDWRYVRNPGHRFRFESLRRGGALAATAVTVERDGACIVCELLVSGRRVDVGRRLVLEIALRALGEGSRLLQGFGSDAGFLAEVFEGFPHHTAFENVFVGRSLADDDLLLRMAIPSNWSIAYGDSDFV